MSQSLAASAKIPDVNVCIAITSSREEPQRSRRTSSAKEGGGACTEVPASVKVALQLRAAVGLEAKAKKGKLASATASVWISLSIALFPLGIAHN